MLLLYTSLTYLQPSSDRVRAPPTSFTQSWTLLSDAWPLHCESKHRCPRIFGREQYLSELSGIWRVVHQQVNREKKRHISFCQLHIPEQARLASVPAKVHCKLATCILKKQLVKFRTSRQAQRCCSTVAGSGVWKKIQAHFSPFMHVIAGRR